MVFTAIARRAGPAASAASRCSRSGLRGSSAMPLRAKILAPQLESRAQMSTQIPEPWTPLRDDEPEDVLFTSLYGLRTIELNRPKKYNSLNGSMIRKIAPRLLEWEKSDMANVIVMKGAGDKAFCAGGDVAVLAKSNRKGPAGQKWSTDYFGLEYKLDHLIATYKKPYIAFMDGITMGGGVGLSIHAPFRIATERTTFAMPETTIGFFPDVGASFFLPRMAGSVGTYLALTSDRLMGANVFYSGIATHYLHSTSLPSLESRLAELRFKDYDSMETRLGIISATLEEYCSGLPHDQPMRIAGELRKAIDRCFSKDNVADILRALDAEVERGASTAKWARKTLETLHQRSPTAVHVTLRQMRIGGEWSIKETFNREYHIASKFMKHRDFIEGVTSLLINKPATKPEWQPGSLEEIQPKDDITEPFFQLSQDIKPLELVNDRDYQNYPYAAFGLPREKDVQAVVGESADKGEIVNKFVAKTQGKQGVKEVVEEIVNRKTRQGQGGRPIWIDDA